MHSDNSKLKRKSIIQLITIVGIALLLHFGIILLLQFDSAGWLQPFNEIVGDVFGTGTEVIMPIASLSVWFFAISIAWFIHRDNPYINNLLIFSLIPLAIMVVVEFACYFLFWDYIHLLPFIVGLYIIWKKRSTLRQKYILLSALGLIGLLFLLYYLNLAYSAIPELMFLIFMPIYFGVLAGVSFFLRGRREPKKGILRKIGKGFLICFWGIGLLLGTMVLYWYMRPSDYVVNENIVIDSWIAVDEGIHNSNSDMIYWNETGVIYLVHDRRPFHLGTPDAKIIVWNSTDARQWTKVAEFNVTGEDVRDPKFGIINNRLYLYFLKNKAFPMAIPYSTVYTYTDDGVNWAPVRDIAPANTLFWGPTTNDNITWYLPAYARNPYSVYLLNSTDGENWSIHATMYSGEMISESAIEFLPDGRMMLVSRMEGFGAGAFGNANASTLIATSPFPYTDWSSYIKSTVDKLDGLALFSYDNKTYAAARHQPGSRGLFTELGSVFTRKRTSLFLVNETTGLTYITDVPSAGDTAYCGVVLNGTEAYISYYTSDIRYDYPWVLGWVAESDIRIAQVNLTALAIWAASL